MKIANEEITNIGMGNIGASRGQGRFRCILGSCIGLSLYDPTVVAGGLAHVVLPDSGGKTGSPGKFADTAVVELLRRLQTYGATPDSIVAKMAGGANMFARCGPLKIGEQNITAVKLALQSAGIRLVAEETGGTKGRRVIFDCGNGDYLVEIVGQASKFI